MTFINLHNQIKKLKREEKETNGDSGASMNQDSTRNSLEKFDEIRNSIILSFNLL